MWVTRERRETLLVEYQLSQEMHNYYGKILWQIGAIFLGGSIGAFGIVVSESIGTMPTPLPLWFWVIQLTMTVGFILFHSRLRNLAYIHLQRCIAIEKELGMKQHTNKEENVGGLGGWVVSLGFCTTLLILTLIIALYMMGFKICWN